MEARTKRLSVWFSKIQTREDALTLIKDVSTMFYFLAALMAVTTFVMSNYACLVDGVIYAAGAFFLRRSSSRAAAVLLLTVSFLALVATFANKLGMQWGGGNNLFLAVIVFWGALRAVYATFKLHALPAESVSGSSM